MWTNLARGGRYIPVGKHYREQGIPESQRCTGVHHLEKTPGPPLHPGAVWNDTKHRKSPEHSYAATDAKCVCTLGVCVYPCCATKLDVRMSNTLTVPELKPQAKMGILGWNATEDGASLGSSETKSYSYTEKNGWTSSVSFFFSMHWLSLTELCTINGWKQTCWVESMSQIRMVPSQDAVVIWRRAGSTLKPNTASVCDLINVR